MVANKLRSRYLSSIANYVTYVKVYNKGFGQNKSILVTAVDYRYIRIAIWSNAAHF